MPNQRSKKKKFIGAYIDYRLKQKIEQIMIDNDLSLTDALEILLRQGVDSVVDQAVSDYLKERDESEK